MTYDITGFLAKTRRRFGVQMARLMQSSAEKQYADLFSSFDLKTMNQKQGKKTVGITFKENVAGLMKV